MWEGLRPERIVTMRPQSQPDEGYPDRRSGRIALRFDTVVISGAIDALVKLYGLSDYGKGWTVAIALIGTVVGALGAGVVGAKAGGRETLRITAVLYVVSPSAARWPGAGPR